MPDVWTHILCGNRALQILHNEELCCEILNRFNIFKLGTQGPDIFYYYKFWKGFNTRGDKILGKLMHTNKTGEFLINCLKYLKIQPDSNDYYELLAYIMGFISHYSLDSISHPFIYSYAFSHSSNSSAYLANSYHKKLEVIIDSIFLNENMNLGWEGIPPYKAIDVGIGVPVIVSECLRCEIEKIYDLKIKKRLIDDAYRDMKVGLRLLYDPNNFKLRMVRILESLLMAPDKYSCAFYPIYVDCCFDYMNNRHEAWIHPYSTSEWYKDSFNDLFNRAIEESSRKIAASINFLNGKISELELTDFFPNISYLTGLQTENCIT